MALNSRICGMLGIDYPIVLAGMGFVLLLAMAWYTAAVGIPSRLGG